ncbi:MAG: multicopper oxidase domain-containing protein [Acetobacteraceae bacterium]
MASWKDRLALTAQRNRLEIIKAKLSRRDLVRMGLLTAGGTLVIKQGLSSRAFADGGGPSSPPIQNPFVQEMPRLPVLPGFTDPNQFARGGPPIATTVIDGATKVHPQQLFTTFPPKKYYELHMREANVQLHPDYPPNSTTVWGFNGQVPGPLIRANYGESTLVRYYNDLPSVKLPAPDGFGIAEISTHLHNAHTPFESDGNPVDFINSINDPTPLDPLGFKDNHYPNVYAGYATLGQIAGASAAGNPNEALGSLWYHDHHLDFTAQNVYKGMFGCYTLFDNVDNNNENDTTPGALKLPSGDFDIPIFFNDFLLNQDHKLVFDLFDLDGILGDRFCANGAIQPKLTVQKRRYRFRLYNPGPSRWYQFALTDPAGTTLFPFWQISSDGNLLPNAVKVTSVRMSVAERVDIVVDCSSAVFGSLTQLFLVNQLEQVNGRGPTGKLLNPGTPIIKINLQPLVGSDPSNPGLAITAGPQIGIHLRDLPDTDAQLAAAVAKARTRTFRFERGNGAWQVNGKFFDEDVVNANPALEGEEVWILQNGGGGWSHPIHAHFEEARPLTHNGAPITQNTGQVNGGILYARRDVIPLEDSSETKVFLRFRDMQGRYVMHCHNVVHEDHAMMIRFDIGTTPPPV